jgi:hypothetical protein
MQPTERVAGPTVATLTAVAVAALASAITAIAAVSAGFAHTTTNATGTTGTGTIETSTIGTTGTTGTTGAFEENPACVGLGIKHERHAAAETRLVHEKVYGAASEKPGGKWKGVKS